MKSEIDQRSHQPEDGRERDRVVSIVEAALLATVALLAAWSGHAAARWSTESRLLLAEASSARIEGNRAAATDAETLAFDTSTFEARFTAYVSGNQTAMDLAARRCRPEFRLAFDAWLADQPFTNADAPPGPTYLPEDAQPERDHAEALDARADAKFGEGAEGADNADRYIRITAFLATVLFLVGISGHFRVRVARYGLVGLSAGILVIAVVLLLFSPKPPM